MVGRALVGLVVCAALSACAPRATCGGGDGVGVIDFRRTLAETRAGQEAKAQIESRKAELQRSLDERKSEVALMQEELERDRPRLDRVEIAEREQAIAAAYGELRREFAALQERLLAEEERATRLVLARTTPVISEIARRDRYDVIVEKQHGFVICPRGRDAPSTQRSVDITDEVNRRLDGP